MKVNAGIDRISAKLVEQYPWGWVTRIDADTLLVRGFNQYHYFRIDAYQTKDDFFDVTEIDSPVSRRVLS